MPKFIFKANDDAISYCSCVGQPAMSMGQLSCPWCGCGWLLSCSRCTKSFTYAVVRHTDIPLIELARREAAAIGLRSRTERDHEEWATVMAEMLEPFQIGDIVVYLDGRYFPLHAKNIRFDGIFATHDLDALPHAAALHDASALAEVLGRKAYWLTRERRSQN